MMVRVNKKSLEFICESILSDLKNSDINSIIKYDNAYDCALEDYCSGKDGYVVGKNMYELMKCNTQMKINEKYSKNNFFCPNALESSIIEKVSYYYISGGYKKEYPKDENGYKAIPFDYDVSLRNILIYGIVYGNNDVQSLLSTLPIKKYEKYKYEITIDNLVYRGDTMNSLNTVFGKFFLYFDKRVPLGKIKRTIYLLENEKYYNCKLPDYVKNYLAVYHSIGNMFMAPKEFNAPRYKKTGDYWDLTLVGLYKWFSNNDKLCDEGLKDIIGTSQSFPDEQKNIEVCRNWLSSRFKDENGNLSWKKFVGDNYLEDFICKCGKPIELWKGHFENANKGNIHPVKNESKDDFKEFFTNSFKSIYARGGRVAKELESNLKQG